MPAPRAPSAQLRLDLERPTPFGAEAFVVSDSNRAAAQALADWPGGVDKVLALAGPPGSGKSHLASIWAERVGAVALDGAEAALIDPLELEDRPVLLDPAADADDETLFHLINLAQSGGGALMLVSRKPPVLWKTEVPDLRSRFDAMRVVKIDEPDDAVLAAMLKQAFERRSMTPDDDVIAYLVRRIGRSAKAAEAAVERLDALPGPVTRVSARAALDAANEDDPLFG